MTRQSGRPADEIGRLEKEIRTYDFLDANHVWYERIDHEAAMTMEVCEEIDKALEADDLQESISVQPAGDKLLSADVTGT